MSRGLSIELRDVVVERPKTGFRLQVDSLMIPAGSSVAIVGPSGSGKSTLLQVMGLLEQPRQGTVLIDGDPADYRDAQARLSVAAVFQRPYLFKGTVEQNVAYGLSVRGVPKAQRSSAVAAILEHVGLAGYGSRGVSQLSGGEAQRVSLARALVLEPALLLLDEPLANLDELLKRDLARTFAQLARETGATVVWVTHDQDEAMVVADHVVIVRDGAVTSSGPMDEVLAVPADDWTAAFLGVEPALTGVVGASEPGVFRVDVQGVEVFATGDVPVGTTVQCAVRPEDVTLFDAAQPPVRSSARNHLHATVTGVHHRGATFLVQLDAGGVRLASTVSRVSVREMGLEPGTSVSAAFKASAVSWRIVSANNADMDTLSS